MTLVNVDGYEDVGQSLTRSRKNFKGLQRQTPENGVVSYFISLALPRPAAGAQLLAEGCEMRLIAAACR